GGPQRRRLGVFRVRPRALAERPLARLCLEPYGASRDLGASVSRGRPGARVEQYRLRAPLVGRWAGALLPPGRCRDGGGRRDGQRVFIRGAETPVLGPVRPTSKPRCSRL